MKRSHRRIVFLVGLIAAYGAIKLVWRGELPAVLQTCTQPLLFAHRGFTQGDDGKWLEGVKTAAEMGFAGVETDVHYFPGEGLIVRHDPRPADVRPEDELRLADLFESERDVRLAWWIDLKNLTDDDSAAIATEFNELVKKYSLSGRMFIESPNGAVLARLREQVSGPMFIFWYQAPRWNPLFDVSADLEQALYGPFLFSVEQSSVTKITEALHASWGIVTWTVDDPRMVQRVIDNGAVIVLTDKDFRTEYPALYRPFDSTCPARTE
jgi:glycerophosphoryl diester phosphodiesterase